MATCVGLPRARLGDGVGALCDDAARNSQDTILWTLLVPLRRPVLLHFAHKAGVIYGTIWRQSKP